MSFSQRYQERWDRASTVRSRPRRRPSGAAGEGDFFPCVRQPLAIHPDVADLGETARTFALVQSAYKYMNDVALTETEVINRTAIRIANGRVAAALSDEVRQIALTVVVDEAYHALVARDFITAVRQSTGIQPLPLPPETELSLAIEALHGELDPALHDDFDVVAICIAENTLTREIVELSRDSELATPFLEALQDHLADEAMHAAFFQRVLATHWQALSDERRAALAAVLPAFVAHYLNVEIQRGFDASILRALGLAEPQVLQIVEDLHGGFRLTPRHPMLASILAMFERVGVFALGPARGAFQASGLLA